MQNNAEKKNDHIIKEAEMIINEYCEKVENSKKKDKLIKRYKENMQKKKNFNNSKYNFCYRDDNYIYKIKQAIIKTPRVEYILKGNVY